ncbi:hypothetical protein [Brassicibacter mesophilus]|uniref:hypothetical protein n=1 Tax=Brassicibacter mesophilus TaxID=745119 RepID=UPI003D19EE21
MEYTSYIELEKDLIALLEQENYREAVDLLGKASEILPQKEFEENYFDILFNKARFSTNCNMYDESIKTLIYLVEQGYACPLQWKRFEPLQQDPRYANLEHKNDLLIKQAQEKSKLEYFVHLPESYYKNKQYPLFINLHGDGENVKLHSQYWKPDAFLKKDFIVVYIQSSQVMHHNSYGWTNDQCKARKEIKHIYDLMIQQYSIDKDCVIIGGFSGGAIASIDIIMANEFPIKGFIALCASEKPESFTKENAQYAGKRGIKGVLMEGEQDIPVLDEEEMVNVFKEVGLPHEYYINKGIGHWYPKDLSEKVEKALEFIL